MNQTERRAGPGLSFDRVHIRQLFGLGFSRFVGDVCLGMCMKGCGLGVRILAQGVVFRV